MKEAKLRRLSLNTTTIQLHDYELLYSTVRSLHDYELLYSTVRSKDISTYVEPESILIAKNLNASQLLTLTRRNERIHELQCSLLYLIRSPVTFAFPFCNATMTKLCQLPIANCQLPMTSIW